MGTKGCKATLLLDFLQRNTCDRLYLVGDIIDGWRLKRSWYWDDTHNEIIRQILKMATSGTKVIYVPGNHDEALRDFPGIMLAGIEIHREYVHTTADDRRLLVLHGDFFDGIVMHARWLALLGDSAYSTSLVLNDWLNHMRHWIGLPNWSLSKYLKLRVKNAVKHISNFETTLARRAKESNFDGVVCGHIHHPEIREIDGVLYCNDGDWVESCTALVEDQSGTLEILHWIHEYSLAQVSESREQAA